MATTSDNNPIDDNPHWKPMGTGPGLRTIRTAADDSCVVGCTTAGRVYKWEEDGTWEEAWQNKSDAGDVHEAIPLIGGKQIFARQELPGLAGKGDKIAFYRDIGEYGFTFEINWTIDFNQEIGEHFSTSMDLAFDARSVDDIVFIDKTGATWRVVSTGLKSWKKSCIVPLAHQVPYQRSLPGLYSHASVDIPAKQISLGPDCVAVQLPDYDPRHAPVPPQAFSPGELKIWEHNLKDAYGLHVLSPPSTGTHDYTHKLSVPASPVTEIRTLTGEFLYLLIGGKIYRLEVSSGHSTQLPGSGIATFDVSDNGNIVALDAHGHPFQYVDVVAQPAPMWTPCGGRGNTQVACGSVDDLMAINHLLGTHDKLTSTVGKWNAWTKASDEQFNWISAGGKEAIGLNAKTGSLQHMNGETWFTDDDRAGPIENIFQPCVDVAGNLFALSRQSWSPAGSSNHPAVGTLLHAPAGDDQLSVLEKHGRFLLLEAAGPNTVIAQDINGEVWRISPDAVPVKILSHAVLYDSNSSLHKSPVSNRAKRVWIGISARAESDFLVLSAAYKQKGSSLLYRWNPISGETLKTDPWDQLIPVPHAPANLIQVHYGQDGSILGLTKDGYLLRCLGIDWVKLPGVGITQFTVEYDGTILALADHGNLYRFEPEFDSYAPDALEGSITGVDAYHEDEYWVVINGGVANSTSPTNPIQTINGKGARMLEGHRHYASAVEGTDVSGESDRYACRIDGGNVWLYAGKVSPPPSFNEIWAHLSDVTYDGKFSRVSVAEDQTIGAVTEDGSLLIWNAGASTWTHVVSALHFKELCVVSASLLYVVTTTNQVHRRANGVWSRVPGKFSDVSAAPDQTVRALGLSGDIWEMARLWRSCKISARDDGITWDLTILNDKIQWQIAGEGVASVWDLYLTGYELTSGERETESRYRVAVYCPEHDALLGVEMTTQTTPETTVPNPNGGTFDIPAVTRREPANRTLAGGEVPLSFRSSAPSVDWDSNFTLVGPASAPGGKPGTVDLLHDSTGLLLIPGPQSMVPVSLAPDCEGAIQLTDVA